MHHSVDYHVSMLYGTFSVSSFLLLFFFDAISDISVTCSGKRWLDNLSRTIIWQPEVNKAVEVIQDFRVAKDRCPPIGIDSTLELSMRFRDLCLKCCDIHGVNGRVAGVSHVDFVVWE